MAKLKRSTPSSSECVGLLRARAQHWTDLPGVTSVGVGYKIVGGERTRQLSIQVTVDRKLSPKQLYSAGRPKLPTSVRGANGMVVPVDVVERRYKPSYQLIAEPPGSPFTPTVFQDPRITRRSWLTTVMPGISVGGINCPVGTIGAIVYDNATGRPCALSNSHVLAAAAGQPGDIVLQPGRSDDADITKTQLGHLLRSHVGLAGDCAISSVEYRLYLEEIFELGITPRRLAKAELGDMVIKSGRTTGVTRGEVVRIGVIVAHDYGPPLGSVQIGGFEVGPRNAATAATQRLSDGGDSGCVWMIEEAGQVTDIAVGLHFAVETDPLTQADHALACNMHSVLEKMDVSLSPKQSAPVI